MASICEKTCPTNEEKGPRQKVSGDPKAFRIHQLEEKDHDKYMSFFKEFFLAREQIVILLNLFVSEFIEYLSATSTRSLFTTYLEILSEVKVGIQLLQTLHEHYHLYSAMFAFELKWMDQQNTGLQVDCDELLELFQRVSKTWLYSGTSLCAIYEPTNEIAGMMINQVLTREKPHTFKEENVDKLSEVIRTQRRVLSMLEDSVNFFEDHTVNKILETRAAVTSPTFSGNKITYRLLEESEKIAMELGCEMAMCISTSIITQHIWSKMGYEVCFTIEFDAIEIDGKRVINMSLIDETKAVKIFKKYLTKK